MSKRTDLFQKFLGHRPFILIELSAVEDDDNSVNVSVEFGGGFEDADIAECLRTIADDLDGGTDDA